VAPGTKQDESDPQQGVSGDGTGAREWEVTLTGRLTDLYTCPGNDLDIRTGKRLDERLVCATGFSAIMDSAKTKRAKLVCGERTAAKGAPARGSGRTKRLPGSRVWGNRAWACGLSSNRRRDKLMTYGVNRRPICEVVQG
jgi:hypothetical protein